MADDASPKSLTEAVQEDRMTALVALRDHLARAIDTCESMRDLAALSLRLTDVLAQIDATPDKAEVSAADEVAARRTARRTSPKSPARTTGAG